MWYERGSLRQYSTFSVRKNEGKIFVTTIKKNLFFLFCYLKHDFWLEKNRKLSERKE